MRSGGLTIPKHTSLLTHFWGAVCSCARRLTALLAVVNPLTAVAQAAIQVSPTSVTLDRPEATQQLLVAQVTVGQPNLDLTQKAAYSVANPQIAAVDEEGLVRPLAEGQTEIVIKFEENELKVPVQVTGQINPTPISFHYEIIPLLTKAGCNAGGCHGKAEGQNGFRLSVFGFDPLFDYESLVKQGRGRRVFPAAAEHSLMLRKATADEPHGGGRRIEPDGFRYRQLARWIAEGAKYTGDESAEVKSIEVEPTHQVLLAQGTQQLRVTAIDASGRRYCVTTEAEYSSNAGVIAGVDDRGLIQASDIPGEAAILVRYMGHVAVCRITIPRPDTQFKRPPEVNFIDKLVWDKLQQLGIEPSELADDATFLRRVYLDTIGTLPTVEEARTFLADTAADKRAKLIDRLLQRPEYADYWTMRWSDILRVDKDKLTPEGAVAVTRWLRKQFQQNRPYDAMVRDILTVKGNTQAEGPAALYRVLDKPEVVGRSFSQIFLGVRIECAQCHHHPFERWGQEDYFGLASFFTGVTRKKLPSGGEAIVARGGVDLKHPRTAQPVPAHGLGAIPIEFAPADDRREALAQWMTTAENPFFATSIANRLWAHYFGRGLVEPLDDLRATNPATNEPLLAALTQQMCAVKFDLKEFTRTLLNSRVYQLSSLANASNASDEQNFSHAGRKAVPAEVLLDAICQVTGVPEEFNGWPADYRSIQIWDNRMPSYFFQVFGRPVRASVCECERGTEPSISQALHLLNSPEITSKIQSRQGVARTLAESNEPPDSVIDQLYLATLARHPHDQERALMMEAFTASDGGKTEDGRRQAVEDILWALLNTKEFLYNH